MTTEPNQNPSVDPSIATTVTAEDDAAGARLDKWMSEAFPALSRSRAKALIEEGRLSVNGEIRTDPRHKVIAGADYVLDIPPPAPAIPQPEDIPLDILFEDDHLIIVHKAAGMVVHPTSGQWSGTLVNAILHHCSEDLTGIGGVARPGIVHRLDKDTSGVMVVAKTEPTHTALVNLFQLHEMERAYLAITRGAPRPLLGRIETYIARSPNDRKKMAVVKDRSFQLDGRSNDPNANVKDAHQQGKNAVTNYKTLKTYGRLDDTGTQPAAALVECRLETGRTHQIRVHMAHIHAPVMGDQTYGKNRGVRAFGKGQAFDHAVETARAFRRQALHAYVLGFKHPITGEDLRFEAAPPEDMANLIKALEGMT